MKPDADRRWFKSIWLTGLLFLAACAGDANPVSLNTPTPQGTPSLLNEPIYANRTPAPAPELEVNAPAPAAIIGWRQDDLSRTFGAASLVRRDLGAEIWQYRNDVCVLFLFLYPKGGAATGNLQVDHLDVRGTDDQGLCLRAVVKARQNRSTG